MKRQKRVTIAAVKPLNGWVLVRNADPEETEGGLVIPGIAKGGGSARRKAIVVAVSDGYWHVGGEFCPPNVKPGDSVWFDQGAQIVTFDGEKDIAMLHQSAIVCVFTDEHEQPGKSTVMARERAGMQ